MSETHMHEDRDRRHRSRYEDKERDRPIPRDRDRDDRHRRDERERRDERRNDDRRGDDRRPRRDDFRDRDRGGDRDRERPRRHEDDHPHRHNFREDREPPRGRREDRERPGSPDRRSPTPSDAVPISQRKRKASGWDVTAPGYEQYTAMQAKQTGLFNLPGANRSHGPQIIGFGAHPPIPTGLVPNTNLARQSRRLYLGSITSLADEDNIALFFNAKMREMGLAQGPGNPVLAVQVNREKNYAFVEFRSAEDATAGMQLDGTVFLDGPLRVRRPHDYAGPETLTSYNTMLPSTVPDSANKIFVGGLPPYLNEDQVVELLKSFGELKSFNLVREHGNGPSKGFAFFEYVDASVTDQATAGLNGMELGDKKLLVQRASVGAKGPMFANLPPEAQAAMEIPAPIRAIDVTSTVDDARILLMLNMVTADELHDEMEYSEILDDVREECARYGDIEDLRVPRPAKRDKSKWGSSEPGALSAAEASKVDEAAGVGRVYVKYKDSDGANMALKALAGRSFGGRSIIATLIADDAQTTPPLDIIFSNNTVAKV